MAAAADLERQRAAYADAAVAAYQFSPQLTALGAISEADGITEVLESTAALQNAESALQGRYDAYDAADTLAQAADVQAAEALADARTAAERAKDSRDAARDAEAAAADEADTYAAERDRMIGQLARLQGISAEPRRAAPGPARGRGRRRSGRGRPAAGRGGGGGAAAGADPHGSAHPDLGTDAHRGTHADRGADAHARTPTAAPTTPTATPTPTPTPTTPPTPPTTPAPPTSGNAAAAIAFARAQLGEPYQYGAAGPNAWDCSGLTMMAWQAGGKSLPHYSVAQYQQSTPISLAQLQPGDLLFWGDGGPTSIYHAAIYTGNGMMIHAPRPGRKVEEVSMYYWITPNYFARP